MGENNMKMRNALCLIGLGVGGTILYQELRSGNLKKAVKQMNRKKTKMLEDLEDMM